MSSSPNPISSAAEARKALGLRLREIRRSRDITARALSVLIDKHHTSISKIENGVKQPTESDIIAWCNACGAESQTADLLATLHAVETAYIEWKRSARAGLRYLGNLHSATSYTTATTFCVHEPTVLPGFLQTEQYVRDRTFLEFFAASQLVKHKPDPGAVWNQLEPHLRDSTWAVVAQLAVQILDRHVDDGADRILRLVLDRVDNPPGAWHGHLAFAARCLENIAPDNSTLREVVTRVVTGSSAVPAAHRRTLTLEQPSTVDDGPLMRLLEVTSPDNTTRIARVAGEVVDSNARTTPLTTSAGLVYHRLMVDKVGPNESASEIGRMVAYELSQHQEPEAAQVWDRLLRRPTADDLAEHGLPLLYELTHFCGVAVLPALSWILRETVAPPVGRHAPNPTAWDHTLEGYYGHIIAGREWLRRLRVSQEVWQPALPRFDEAALLAVSPHARAALVLLLLPVAEVARNRPDNDRLEQLVHAAEHGYRRAALDILNSWALPTEAHDFLVEWIYHDRVTV